MPIRGIFATSGAPAASGRAAEQRDELAPSQLIELHSVPSHGRISEYRIGNGQSGGVEGVRNSRRLGTSRAIIQIIPTPQGRLRSISTRRQQAAVGGGQSPGRWGWGA